MILKIKRTINTTFFFTKKLRRWLKKSWILLLLFRNIPPEVFSGKGVLKICTKFTEEHPCRCMISLNSFTNLSLIRYPYINLYSTCTKLYSLRFLFNKWSCRCLSLNFPLVSYIFICHLVHLLNSKAHVI